MANASLRMLGRAGALGLIRGSSLSLRGLYSVEKLASSQLLSHLLGSQCQGSGYLQRVPDFHFQTLRLYSRGRRAEITDEEDAGDEDGDLIDEYDEDGDLIDEFDEEWAGDGDLMEHKVDIVEPGSEDDGDDEKCVRSI